MISTVAPSSLSSGVYSSSNGLNLNLLGNLNNFGGSILSNGTVNISAGGSNFNNVISSTGVVPVISGSSVSLTSQTGGFTNSGTITANTGNIAFSSPRTAQLNLNDTGGRLVANHGSINFTNPLISANQTLSLIGGDFLAKNGVNVNAGNGAAYININNINAPLNVSASSAHITAATANLILGTQNITGDPTYYNTAGDVTLSSDISTGGANLAIVAAGNIVESASATGDINLNSGGGAITLLAGFNFTASDSTTSGNPGNPTTILTVTGGSSTGGNIMGAMGNINLISNGGAIILAAHSNAQGQLGTVNIGNINSGSTGTGVNGNVTIYAGSFFNLGRRVIL